MIVCHLQTSLVLRRLHMIPESPIFRITHRITPVQLLLELLPGFHRIMMKSNAISRYRTPPSDCSHHVPMFRHRVRVVFQIHLVWIERRVKFRGFDNGLDVVVIICAL